MKLDVLAFGAHPDDVELSCAGVLLMEQQRGKKTGIIDLTEGELGTRGTVATRYAEAAASAAILKVAVRENLKLEDGFLNNSKANLYKVIAAIRKYKPEIVFCNAIEDRHPDHGNGAKLVSEACFLSGLRKIETQIDGVAQTQWRPKQCFHYIQDRYLDPQIIVDISAVMQQKIEAIKAFATQFNNTDTSEPTTYISDPKFLDGIYHRAAQYGKSIGVNYAEGFISSKKIGVHSIFDLVLLDT
jgi:N-acetylglucosamine malate deacetylase 1